MAKTQKRGSTSKKTIDPVTRYARDVIAGKVVAGPHVRAACKRHLDDLKNASTRGYKFDVELVKWVFGFFEDVLRLNGGQWEGKPFKLDRWQQFVVGSVFGWIDADGNRRFRVVYIETGKGSGKSPMAAGIGLYGMTEMPRAEVYAAATKKDQAMILFRDAIAMVDQSPELRQRTIKSGSPGKEWNIAYPKQSSFFRPISADDGQSGPRPHVSVIDEVHEHKSSNVIEMLRAGAKNDPNALIFMITNSGVDKNSICYQYHEYGIKVCEGSLQDDTLFAYVCALDVGDDPLKDESCWIKANPSLGIGLPGKKYLREQVTAARGMPAKESIVRRLNFCEWVESASPWISAQAWALCNPEENFDEELLLNRRCFGGLDLSSTQDLTALALVFEPIARDPVWRLRLWFWIPGDGLMDRADRDRVPYDVWRNAGWINALLGRAINKLAILHTIAQLAARYDIEVIAYDRWRIEDLKMLIEKEGLPIPKLVPYGQGFKDMAPAVDEFERLILSEKIKHDGNPCLTWNAANAVIDTDPAGNRKVTKERALGRVDGIVASVMAIGCSMQEHEDDKKIITQGIVELG